LPTVSGAALVLDAMEAELHNSPKLAATSAVVRAAAEFSLGLHPRSYSG
jgi:hypothetical protein